MHYELLVKYSETLVDTCDAYGASALAELLDLLAKQGFRVLRIRALGFVT